MESNEFHVEFITNKRYFIDDTLHISFKFNEKVRILFFYEVNIYLSNIYDCD